MVEWLPEKCIAAGSSKHPSDGNTSDMDHFLGLHYIISSLKPFLNTIYHILLREALFYSWTGSSKYMHIFMIHGPYYSIVGKGRAITEIYMYEWTQVMVLCPTEGYTFYPFRVIPCMRYSEREREGREEGKREWRYVTFTTKEEMESGSSRAVEERTSFNRKQKSVILGKVLCEDTP